MESKENEQSAGHTLFPARNNMQSSDAQSTQADHGAPKTEQQDVEADSRYTENQADPVLTVKDWTSHDDPENPINWAQWKRIYHTMIPSIQAFTM